MTAPVKYYCFVEDLAEKRHDLGADTFKIALTNRAPVVATDATLADIAELAAGNGYLAGGVAAAVTSSAQAAGVYKQVLADPAGITAAGGAIGPFRYGVLYNASSGNRLIQSWDYGVSTTLQVGERLDLDLDGVNGVLQGS